MTDYNTGIDRYDHSESVNILYKSKHQKSGKNAICISISILSPLDIQENEVLDAKPSVSALRRLQPFKDQP